MAAILSRPQCVKHLNVFENYIIKMETHMSQEPVEGVIFVQ